MRLHFSIGCDDYRRTARFRQSIHFSRIQLFLADHMHRRAGVDNKFSFLKFKIWCRPGTNFPKERRMLLYFSPWILEHSKASLHAASRAPCSCHSVSSWDRSSEFGGLGLRGWSSPGQIIPSDGFLVSNVSVTYNGFCEFYTSDRFVYVWALPWNRRGLQRLHILRCATQLSFNFLHSHCTFVTILFRPFMWLFINLAMRIRALLSKSASILRFVEQAFWRMPFFTEWIGASSFWGNPCTAVEPFSHLGFCLQDFWFSMQFFTLCCVRDLGEGFSCVIFARLFVSCRKLQLSPLTHCPLDSQCQQSSRILCSRCFVPWFLTTVFFSKFPLLAPKFLFRISCSILLFTIAFNLW